MSDITDGFMEEVGMPEDWKLIEARRETARQCAMICDELAAVDMRVYAESIGPDVRTGAKWSAESLQNAADVIRKEFHIKAAASAK